MYFDKEELNKILRNHEGVEEMTIQFYLNTRNYDLKEED